MPRSAKRAYNLGMIRPLTSLLIFCLFGLLATPQHSIAMEPRGPTWQTEIANETLIVFQEFFSALSRPFRIEKRWEDPSVVGGAINDGSEYLVTLHGGLLRHPHLDKDTLRITICHEMGHHFGGAPRRSAPMEWPGPFDRDGRMLSSSEGQADYYTTATCFRKLVDKNDSSSEISQDLIPPTLKKKCEASWGSHTKESRICIRSVVAARKLLTLNHPFEISVETPSLTPAPRLIRDEFPSRQCRLDTYLAGALCRDQLPLQFSEDDAKPTRCSHPEGQQPSCWFPSDRGDFL